MPAVVAQAAVDAILGSTAFRNAPRMCRLLRYLIDKLLANALRDINQHSIGIAVFDRDPSVYDPVDDPVVRVQVGRLRDKLKAYYASASELCACLISIPVGQYLPVITPLQAAARRGAVIDTLAVLQLACMSENAAFQHFTHGVNDELNYQLFREFGRKLMLPSPRSLDGNIASHVLEGSLRMDQQRIRGSFRLLQVREHNLVWCEQLDVDATLSISLQEEISGFVRSALRCYVGAPGE